MKLKKGLAAVLISTTLTSNLPIYAPVLANTSFEDTDNFSDEIFFDEQLFLQENSLDLSFSSHADELILSDQLLAFDEFSSPDFNSDSFIDDSSIIEDFEIMDQFSLPEEFVPESIGYEIPTLVDNSYVDHIEEIDYLQDILDEFDRVEAERKLVLVYENSTAEIQIGLKCISKDQMDAYISELTEFRTNLLGSYTDFMDETAYNSQKDMLESIEHNFKQHLDKGTYFSLNSLQTLLDNAQDVMFGIISGPQASDVAKGAKFVSHTIYDELTVHITEAESYLAMSVENITEMIIANIKTLETNLAQATQSFIDAIEIGTSIEGAKDLLADLISNAEDLNDKLACIEDGDLLYENQQYILKEDKQTFTDAIDDAQEILDAIYENGSTRDVEGAILAIRQATALIETKVRIYKELDTIELEQLIDSALKLSAEIETRDIAQISVLELMSDEEIPDNAFVTKEEMKALLNAIEIAQAIVADPKNLTTIDLAVQDLKVAIAIFKNNIKIGSEGEIEDVLQSFDMFINDIEDQYDDIMEKCKIINKDPEDVDKGQEYISKLADNTMRDAIDKAKEISEMIFSDLENCQATIFQERKNLEQALIVFKSSIQVGTKKLDVRMLERLIEDALEEKSDVVIRNESEDEVEAYIYFVDEETMNEFKAVIEAAQELVKNPLDIDDINAMENALDLAMDNFKDAKSRGRGENKQYVFEDLQTALSQTLSVKNGVLILEEDQLTEDIALGTKFILAEDFELFDNNISPIEREVEKLVEDQLRGYTPRINSNKIREYMVILEVAVTDFTDSLQIGTGLVVEVNELAEVVNNAFVAKMDVFEAEKSSYVMDGKSFVTPEIMAKFNEAINSATIAMDSPRDLLTVIDAKQALEDEIRVFKYAIEQGTKVSIIDLSELRNAINGLTRQTRNLIGTDLSAAEVPDSLTFVSPKEYDIIQTYLGRANTVLVDAEMLNEDSELSEIKDMEKRVSIALDHIYDVPFDIEIHDGRLEISELEEFFDNCLLLLENDIAIYPDDVRSEDVDQYVEYSTITDYKALMLEMAKARSVIENPYVFVDDQDSDKIESVIDTTLESLQEAYDSFYESTKYGDKDPNENYNDRKRNYNEEDDENSQLKDELKDEIKKLEDLLESANHIKFGIYVIATDNQSVEEGMAKGVKYVSIDAVNDLNDEINDVTNDFDNTLSDFNNIEDDDISTTEIEDVISSLEDYQDTLQDAISDFKYEIQEGEKVYEHLSNISALVEEIESAYAAMYGVKSINSIADLVSLGTKFVSPAELEEYIMNIAQAESVIRLASNATEQLVAETIYSLNDSIRKFKDAIQEGNYLDSTELLEKITEINRLLGNVITLGDRIQESEVDKGTVFISRSNRNNIIDLIIQAQTAIDNSDPIAMDEALESLDDIIRFEFADYIKVGTFANNTKLENQIEKAWHLIRNTIIMDDEMEPGNVANDLVYANYSMLETLADEIINGTSILLDPDAEIEEIAEQSRVIELAMEEFQKNIILGALFTRTGLDTSALIESIGEAKSVLEVTMPGTDPSLVETGLYIVDEEFIDNLIDKVRNAEFLLRNPGSKYSIESIIEDLDEQIDELVNNREEANGPVNLSMIESLINKAENIIADVNESEDTIDEEKLIQLFNKNIFEVPIGIKFVNTFEYNELTEALDDAQNKLSGNKQEVENATLNLSDAISLFQANIKSGKGSPESGADNVGKLLKAIQEANDQKKNVTILDLPPEQVAQGVKFVTSSMMESLNQILLEANLLLTKLLKEEGLLQSEHSQIENIIDELERVLTEEFNIEKGQLETGDLIELIAEAKSIREMDGDHKIYILLEDSDFLDSDPSNDTRDPITVDKGIHYVSPSVATELDLAIADAESAMASSRSSASKRSVDLEYNLQTAIETFQKSIKIGSATIGQATDTNNFFYMYMSTSSDDQSLAQTIQETESLVNKSTSEEIGILGTDKSASELDSRVQFVDKELRQSLDNALDEGKSKLALQEKGDDPDDLFDVARAINSIRVREQQLLAAAQSGLVNTEALRSLLANVMSDNLTIGQSTQYGVGDIDDPATNQTDSDKKIKVIDRPDDEPEYSFEYVDANVKFISSQEFQQIEDRIEDTINKLLALTDNQVDEDIAIKPLPTSLLPPSLRDTSLGEGGRSRSIEHNEVSQLKLQLEDAYNLLSEDNLKVGSANLYGEYEDIPSDKEGASLTQRIYSLRRPTMISPDKEAMMIDTIQILNEDPSNVQSAIQYVRTTEDKTELVNALEFAESLTVDNYTDPFDVSTALLRLKRAQRKVLQGEIDTPSNYEDLIKLIDYANSLRAIVGAGLSPSGRGMSAKLTGGEYVYTTNALALNDFDTQLDIAQKSLLKSNGSDEIASAINNLQAAIQQFIPQLKWDTDHSLTIDDLSELSFSHANTNDLIQDFQIEKSINPDTSKEIYVIKMPVGTNAFAIDLNFNLGLSEDQYAEVITDLDDENIFEDDSNKYSIAISEFQYTNPTIEIENSMLKIHDLRTLAENQLTIKLMHQFISPDMSIEYPSIEREIVYKFEVANTAETSDLLSRLSYANKLITDLEVITDKSIFESEQLGSEENPIHKGIRFITQSNEKILREALIQANNMKDDLLPDKRILAETITNLTHALESIDLGETSKPEIYELENVEKLNKLITDTQSLLTKGSWPFGPVNPTQEPWLEQSLDDNLDDISAQDLYNELIVANTYYHTLQDAYNIEERISELTKRSEQFADALMWKNGQTLDLESLEILTIAGQPMQGVNNSESKIAWADTGWSPIMDENNEPTWPNEYEQFAKIYLPAGCNEFLLKVAGKESVIVEPIPKEDEGIFIESDGSIKIENVSNLKTTEGTVDIRLSKAIDDLKVSKVVKFKIDIADDISLSDIIATAKEMMRGLKVVPNSVMSEYEDLHFEEKVHKGTKFITVENMQTLRSALNEAEKNLELGNNFGAEALQIALGKIHVGKAPIPTPDEINELTTKHLNKLESVLKKAEAILYYTTLVSNENDHNDIYGDPTLDKYCLTDMEYQAFQSAIAKITAIFITTYRDMQHNTPVDLNKEEHQLEVDIKTAIDQLSWRGNLTENDPDFYKLELGDGEESPLTDAITFSDASGVEINDIVKSETEENTIELQVPLGITNFTMNLAVKPHSSIHGAGEIEVTVPESGETELEVTMQHSLANDLVSQVNSQEQTTAADEVPEIPTISKTMKFSIVQNESTDLSSDLQSRIDYAKNAAQGVIMVSDGTENIYSGEKFLTVTEANSLVNAIQKAESLIDSGISETDEIQDAIKAITSSVEKIKVGSMPTIVVNAEDILIELNKAKALAAASVFAFKKTDEPNDRVTDKFGNQVEHYWTNDEENKLAFDKAIAKAQTAIVTSPTVEISNKAEIINDLHKAYGIFESTLNFYSDPSSNPSSVRSNILPSDITFATEIISDVIYSKSIDEHNNNIHTLKVPAGTKKLDLALKLDDGVNVKITEGNDFTGLEEPSLDNGEAKVSIDVVQNNPNEDKNVQLENRKFAIELECSKFSSDTAHTIFDVDDLGTAVPNIEKTETFILEEMLEPTRNDLAKRIEFAETLINGLIVLENPEAGTVKKSINIANKIELDRALRVAKRLTSTSSEVENQRAIERLTNALETIHKNENGIDLDEDNAILQGHMAEVEKVQTLISSTVISPDGNYDLDGLSIENYWVNSQAVGETLAESANVDHDLALTAIYQAIAEANTSIYGGSGLSSYDLETAVDKFVAYLRFKNASGFSAINISPAIEFTNSNDELITWITCKNNYDNSDLLALDQFTILAPTGEYKFNMKITPQPGVKIKSIVDGSTILDDAIIDNFVATSDPIILEVDNRAGSFTINLAHDFGATPIDYPEVINQIKFTIDNTTEASIPVSEIITKAEQEMNELEVIDENLVESTSINLFAVPEQLANNAIANKIHEGVKYISLEDWIALDNALKAAQELNNGGSATANSSEIQTLLTALANIKKGKAPKPTLDKTTQEKLTELRNKIIEAESIAYYTVRESLDDDNFKYRLDDQSEWEKFKGEIAKANTIIYTTTGSTSSMDEGLKNAVNNLQAEINAFIDKLKWSAADGLTPECTLDYIEVKNTTAGQFWSDLSGPNTSTGEHKSLITDDTGLAIQDIEYEFTEPTLENVNDLKTYKSKATITVPKGTTKFNLTLKVKDDSNILISANNMTAEECLIIPVTLPTSGKTKFNVTLSHNFDRLMSSRVRPEIYRPTIVKEIEIEVKTADTGDLGKRKEYIGHAISNLDDLSTSDTLVDEIQFKMLPNEIKAEEINKNVRFTTVDEMLYIYNAIKEATNPDVQLEAINKLTIGAEMIKKGQQETVTRIAPLSKAAVVDSSELLELVLGKIDSNGTLMDNDIKYKTSDEAIAKFMTAIGLAQAEIYSGPESKVIDDRQTAEALLKSMMEFSEQLSLKTPVESTNLLDMEIVGVKHAKTGQKIDAAKVTENIVDLSFKEITNEDISNETKLIVDNNEAYTISVPAGTTSFAFELKLNKDVKAQVSDGSDILATADYEINHSSTDNEMATIFIEYDDESDPAQWNIMDESGGNSSLVEMTANKFMLHLTYSSNGSDPDISKHIRFEIEEQVADSELALESVIDYAESLILDSSKKVETLLIVPDESSLSSVPDTQYAIYPAEKIKLDRALAVAYDLREKLKQGTIVVTKEAIKSAAENLSGALEAIQLGENTSGGAQYPNPDPNPENPTLFDQIYQVRELIKSTSVTNNLGGQDLDNIEIGNYKYWIEFEDKESALGSTPDDLDDNLLDLYTAIANAYSVSDTAINSDLSSAYESFIDYLRWNNSSADNPGMISIDELEISSNKVDGGLITGATWIGEWTEAQEKLTSASGVEGSGQSTLAENAVKALDKVIISVPQGTFGEHGSEATNLEIKITPAEYVKIAEPTPNNLPEMNGEFTLESGITIKVDENNPNSRIIMIDTETASPDFEFALTLTHDLDRHFAFETNKYPEVENEITFSIVEEQATSKVALEEMIEKVSVNFDDIEIINNDTVVTIDQIPAGIKFMTAAEKYALEKALEDAKSYVLVNETSMTSSYANPITLDMNTAMKNLVIAYNQVKIGTGAEQTQIVESNAYKALKGLIEEAKKLQKATVDIGIGEDTSNIYGSYFVKDAESKRTFEEAIATANYKLLTANDIAGVEELITAKSSLLAAQVVFVDKLIWRNIDSGANEYSLNVREAINNDEFDEGDLGDVTTSAGGKIEGAELEIETDSSTKEITGEIIIPWGTPQFKVKFEVKPAENTTDEPAKNSGIFFSSSLNPDNLSEDSIIIEVDDVSKLTKLNPSPEVGPTNEDVEYAGSFTIKMYHNLDGEISISETLSKPTIMREITVNVARRAEANPSPNSLTPVIENANVVLIEVLNESIKTFPDGTLKENVKKGDKFLTTSECEAIESAIASANALKIELDTEEIEDEDISKIQNAIAALNFATSQVKIGTNDNLINNPLPEVAKEDENGEILPPSPDLSFGENIVTCKETIKAFDPKVNEGSEEVVYELKLDEDGDIAESNEDAVIIKISQEVMHEYEEAIAKAYASYSNTTKPGQVANEEELKEALLSADRKFQQECLNAMLGAAQTQSVVANFVAENQWDESEVQFIEENQWNESVNLQGARVINSILRNYAYNEIKADTDFTHTNTTHLIEDIQYEGGFNSRFQYENTITVPYGTTKFDLALTLTNSKVKATIEPESIKNKVSIKQNPNINPADPKEQIITVDLGAGELDFDLKLKLGRFINLDFPFEVKIANAPNINALKERIKVAEAWMRETVVLNNDKLGGNVKSGINYITVENKRDFDKALKVAKNVPDSASAMEISTALDNLNGELEHISLGTGTFSDVSADTLKNNIVEAQKIIDKVFISSNDGIADENSLNVGENYWVDENAVETFYGVIADINEAIYCTTSALDETVQLNNLATAQFDFVEAIKWGAEKNSLAFENLADIEFTDLSGNKISDIDEASQSISVPDITDGMKFNMLVNPSSNEVEVEALYKKSGNPGTLGEFTVEPTSDNNYLVTVDTSFWDSSATNSMEIILKHTDGDRTLSQIYPFDIELTAIDNTALDKRLKQAYEFLASLDLATDELPSKVHAGIKFIGESEYTTLINAIEQANENTGSDYATLVKNLTEKMEITPKIGIASKPSLDYTELERYIAIAKANTVMENLLVKNNHSESLGTDEYLVSVANKKTLDEAIMDAKIALYTSTNASTQQEIDTATIKLDIANSKFLGELEWGDPTKYSLQIDDLKETVDSTLGSFKNSAGQDLAKIQLTDGDADSYPIITVPIGMKEFYVIVNKTEANNDSSFTIKTDEENVQIPNISGSGTVPAVKAKVEDGELILNLARATGEPALSRSVKYLIEEKDLDTANDLKRELGELANYAKGLLDTIIIILPDNTKAEQVHSGIVYVTETDLTQINSLITLANTTSQDSDNVDKEKIRNVIAELTAFLEKIKSGQAEEPSDYSSNDSSSNENSISSIISKAQDCANKAGEEDGKKIKLVNIASDQVDNQFWIEESKHETLLTAINEAEIVRHVTDSTLVDDTALLITTFKDAARKLEIAHSEYQANLHWQSNAQNTLSIGTMRFNNTVGNTISDITNVAGTTTEWPQIIIPAGTTEFNIVVDKQNADITLKAMLNSTALTESTSGQTVTIPITGLNLTAEQPTATLQITLSHTVGTFRQDRIIKYTIKNLDTDNHDYDNLTDRMNYVKTVISGIEVIVPNGTVNTSVPAGINYILEDDKNTLKEDFAHAKTLTLGSDPDDIKTAISNLTTEIQKVKVGTKIGFSDNNADLKNTIDKAIILAKSEDIKVSDSNSDNNYYWVPQSEKNIFLEAINTAQKVRYEITSGVSAEAATKTLLQARSKYIGLIKWDDDKALTLSAIATGDNGHFIDAIGLKIPDISVDVTQQENGIYIISVPEGTTKFNLEVSPTVSSDVTLSVESANNCQATLNDNTISVIDITNLSADDNKFTVKLSNRLNSYNLERELYFKIQTADNIEDRQDYRTAVKEAIDICFQDNTNLDESTVHPDIIYIEDSHYATLLSELESATQNIASLTAAIESAKKGKKTPTFNLNDNLKTEIDNAEKLEALIVTTDQTGNQTGKYKATTQNLTNFQNAINVAKISYATHDANIDNAQSDLISERDEFERTLVFDTDKTLDNSFTATVENGDSITTVGFDQENPGIFFSPTPSETQASLKFIYDNNEELSIVAKKDDGIDITIDPEKSTDDNTKIYTIPIIKTGGTINDIIVNGKISITRTHQFPKVNSVTPEPIEITTDYLVTMINEEKSTYQDLSNAVKYAKTICFINKTNSDSDLSTVRKGIRFVNVTDHAQDLETALFKANEALPEESGMNTALSTMDQQELLTNLTNEFENILVGSSTTLNENVGVSELKTAINTARELLIQTKVGSEGVSSPNYFVEQQETKNTYINAIATATTVLHTTGGNVSTAKTTLDGATETFKSAYCWHNDNYVIKKVEIDGYANANDLYAQAKIDKTSAENNIVIILPNSITGEKKLRLQLTGKNGINISDITKNITDISGLTVHLSDIINSSVNIDITISDGANLTPNQTFTVTLNSNCSEENGKIELTFSITKGEPTNSSSLHSIAHPHPTDDPTQIASALAKPSLAKNMIGKISHALKGVFARL